VGARNAAECLALQLKALPETTPFRGEALKVVTNHLPLLAARDFTRLKRLLHTDDVGVRAMRALIMSLNPRPRRGICQVRSELCHPGCGRT
jgi:RNA polymerase sigma-54 factor